MSSIQSLTAPKALVHGILAACFCLVPAKVRDSLSDVSGPMKCGPRVRFELYEKGIGEPQTNWVSFNKLRRLAMENNSQN